MIWNRPAEMETFALIAHAEVGAVVASTKEDTRTQEVEGLGVKQININKGKHSSHYLFSRM